MSKKLLKKLSTIIANPEEKSTAIDPEAEKRLNSLLEDHLDIIAGAHDSIHTSNHHSSIN